ncbi:hypothetical protein CRP01_19860 [Flavilitoribacter nigricans DSM 23189 = NBRC 102662]|uniref:Alpha/beta hydrolase domain-containing protein n=2 Tax=Flavilitoribacter TaxID=2762562 RepID=A0A2D0N954_FLAN2|nr:hypothetical protein CRP01_19860 [Flavilitoribacter nigricans DSM 23189 = NBRC 102662]
MAEQKDALSNRTDGILSHLYREEHAPKIFQVNTGYEYWGRSASLIHTTADGTADLELLPNERIYHIASGQHFVDQWPPRRTYGRGPLNAFLGDPLEFRVNYRALLLHLTNWVDQDQAPPASRYPRIADGTLVPKEAVRFPALPGIDFPTTIQNPYRVDYGPRWQEAGIIDRQPPVLGYAFPNLVPQVDSLGNELGGIRNLEVRVPLATYTPWSLRLDAPANQHELIDFRGLFIPLAQTEVESQEKGDPRPSVDQLYPEASDYSDKTTAALDALIEEGFVLERDRDFVQARAQSYWEWVHREPELETVTTGPANGSLIVIGGGRLDPVFYQKFQELAGGPDAPIVIIPTANSDGGLARDPKFERLQQRFREEGFTNISVRHTRDPKEANEEAFVRAIREAKGVWFPGGRQWRLADSYLGTATQEALNDLLERGGVIAGTSAGATIQGSYLARGDTQTNTLMMGDHEEGLGFISNIAIDQHLLARNRQFDLFEILDVHPELLGIGLDENTGIVVQKDEFEVIGASYIAVYDGKKWSPERRAYFPLSKQDKRFYLLPAGARYNMRERRVIDR